MLVKVTLYLLKTNYYIQTLGFQYLGFNWYLSEEGASCDNTCNTLGLMNLATKARNFIPEGDCTLIEHFIGQTKDEQMNKGTTPFWTFGYTKVVGNDYYCTTYGYKEQGTKVGTKKTSPNVRIVCPCSLQGKNSQGLLD